MKLTSFQQSVFFPNPIISEAVLKLDDPDLMVRLYNASGKLIRDYGRVNSNQLIIKKGDLSPGVYLLHIIDPYMEIVKPVKVFVE